MSKIPYVKINNFECPICKTIQYDLISLSPLVVVCSGCGDIIDGNKVKINIEEVEEQNHD